MKTASENGIEMKNSLSRVLPVIFGFFVMGFCDVVGIATSYVKQDFGLSETMAGFIPSMVFIWFLVLSIPAAVWMNRIGRKKMVQTSNLVTFIGMLIPFIDYSYATCMAGFVFLGIGNTILQVSLNPLLTNVVSKDKLTSMLTTGQVVKTVSSLLGPILAAFALNVLGEWQYLFPIYAGITLLSSIWLGLSDIPKETSPAGTSSFASVFSLLKDKTILFLFLGIFFIVGTDIGTNTATPKLLMERAGFSVEQAGLGSSVYFVCRTVGALLGSFLLIRMNDVRYFRTNILLAAASLVCMFFAQGPTLIMILTGCIGFFCSSVFSVLYGQAMKHRPEKANEISGLMIMGVSGGAVTPPVMGIMADTFQSQNGSVAVIGVCLVYLICCAFKLRTR